MSESSTFLIVIIVPELSGKLKPSGSEKAEIINPSSESQWEFPRADQDTIMMENGVLQPGGEKEFNYQS